MPTKKKRVGFIPRDEVLELINKLSYESNLSYSKIINILVEEALNIRGMFNIKSDKVSKNNKNIIINTPIKESTGNINNEYNRNLQNNLLKDKSLIIKDIEEEKFDIEIYEKFLMFLQFQERMKKRN